MSSFYPQTGLSTSFFSRRAAGLSLRFHPRLQDPRAFAGRMDNPAPFAEGILMSSQGNPAQPGGFQNVNRSPPAAA